MEPRKRGRGRDDTLPFLFVAFYAHPDISPTELCEKLNQTNLPKLWIPKRENLYRIDAILLLGSGKVDLKQVKTMAMEKAKE